MRARGAGYIDAPSLVEVARLAKMTHLTGYRPAQPDRRFALHSAVLGARLLDWPASHSLPECDQTHAAWACRRWSATVTRDEPPLGSWRPGDGRRGGNPWVS